MVNRTAELAATTFDEDRTVRFEPRGFRTEGSAIPKSLTIVIPALNEEEAIGHTLERCLAARESIKKHSPIEEIEIVVVSDGSTDRTAEIARSYDSVKVIAYEKNRGYGAAIRLGFASASGELVCFMDADGTCDPEYFTHLCNAVIDGPADIVLGSRMHKESRMPGIRRVGNRIYAALVSYLSGKRIDDTATGMRVLRKSVLPKLYPLPTGLHFTPAMTFRALVADLAVVEVPMPYHERTGRSKLNVFRDGLRFFLAILEIALCFCPLKFFGGMSALLFAAALLYGIGPAWDFATKGVFPDNFLYRQIAISGFVLSSLLVLSIGVVAERVAAALKGNDRSHSLLGRIVLAVCSTRKMLIAGCLFILFGIVLNFGGLTEYFRTRHVSYHWGFLSMGSLVVLAGLQFAAMGIFEFLVTRIMERNGNGCAIEND